ARRIGALINPDNAVLMQSTMQELEQIAGVLGLNVQILRANSRSDINAAFAMLARERPDALFIGPGPFFVLRAVQLANLAARHAIPSAFAVRDNVASGGLISYGTESTMPIAKLAPIPVVFSTGRRRRTCR